MLRPACCHFHSFISPPNLTSPHCALCSVIQSGALYSCSHLHYCTICAVCWCYTIHILCIVVQLFNLCKWGLIYGAAVRKETGWHCVKAKLHSDKCHQCTLQACPQNHVCVYQKGQVFQIQIFSLCPEPLK